LIYQGEDSETNAHGKGISLEWHIPLCQWRIWNILEGSNEHRIRKSCNWCTFSSYKFSPFYCNGL